MSNDILVFPRYLIENCNDFQTWNNSYNMIENIKYYYQWLGRDIAEESDNFIQVISCVFLCNTFNRYVVFQSIDNNKPYLNEKYSLLVGGHVDYNSNKVLHNILKDNLHKEISEEINISKDYTISPIGIIVDKSSIEKSKHLCFLYRMYINDYKITIKSHKEFKNTVNYFNNKDLEDNYGKFDPWSQIIIANIISNNCLM